MFTNTTLNRLGIGGTATGHFHFRNNETEDMLVYQSNPVGVELFSYEHTFVGLCYIFCAQKYRPAK